MQSPRITGTLHSCFQLTKPEKFKVLILQHIAFRRKPFNIHYRGSQAIAPTLAIPLRGKQYGAFQLSGTLHHLLVWANKPPSL